MPNVYDLLKQKENGAGLYIFDVRSQYEYGKSHISGTLNLPFDEITNMTNILPNRSAEIYLFCRTGRYSSSAKTVLSYLGYQNVHDLGAVSAARPR